MSPSIASRREGYRAILGGSGCARPAIIYDPLSARMAEEIGYELGMIPGSDLALSVLGAPDIALVTMSEFVEQVHRTTRVTSMPLMADGDHGYGNAINVRRFVRELETVGLCGVTIEDTELPAAYGTTGGRLITIAEASGKLRAAGEGRTDPLFVIIGRTNLALAAGGLDESIARLRAYEAAGVDALFLQGLKTRQQLEAISAAVTLPLVTPKPVAELDDAEYLARQRVRIAFPTAKKAMTAAIDAAHEALVAMRAGGTAIATDHAKLLRRLTRADDFDAAHRDYLTDRAG